MRRLVFAAIAFFLCLAATLYAAAPARAQEGDAKAFETLRTFYAARAYKPVWTEGNMFTARGRALPAILSGASAHGIAPETYSVSLMAAMLAEKAPQTAADWQKAETLWTYALWSYASDLMGAPVDADTLSSILEGDIEDNLAALAPSTPLYAALKSRLALVDGMLEAGGGKPADTGAPLNFGRALFKPGMSHPDVKRLRERMAAYLELSAGKAKESKDVSESKAGPAAGASGKPASGDVYDPALARAVSVFQKEYGLKDDGAIGPVTQGILNRSPEAEREQIVANLQRLREPHRRLREDTRIEVSIARYWLTAYDGGKPALEMAVIVGQPKRQTISFRTEISGVRLNPDWNVPDTIKREDFLPMLVKDPARMLRQHQGVRVVHAGKDIDPVKTDWTQFSAKELSQLRFWRPAGDGNPLGRYRVIMENPYDIYLHDTNHPDLFALSMRAQSSGCVRVSDPAALTNFILNHKDGWNSQKTADIVKKGRTVDVVMERKIPIYLDYMTAWFNDRHQVILGVDVYNLDTPRYEGLVKRSLTTQRNAQKILDRVTEILTPELQEAHHREPVLAQTTQTE